MLNVIFTIVINMTRKEAITDTYNKITDALFIYRCYRNERLGLVDEKIEKKITALTNALYKQVNKVLKEK